MNLAEMNRVSIYIYIDQERYNIYALQPRPQLWNPISALVQNITVYWIPWWKRNWKTLPARQLAAVTARQQGHIIKILIKWETHHWSLLLRREFKLAIWASHCSSSCKKDHNPKISKDHVAQKYQHTTSTTHPNQPMCIFIYIRGERASCKIAPFEVIVKEISVQGRLNDSCDPGCKPGNLSLNNMKDTCRNQVFLSRSEMTSKQIFRKL